MAVTRSWSAPGTRPAVVAVERPRPLRSELLWLLAASIFVIAGLAMVYTAKTVSLAGVTEKLDRGGLVNLNAVSNPDDLLPLLESFPDRGERALVAEKMFAFLQRNHRAACPAEQREDRRWRRSWTSIRGSWG